MQLFFPLEPENRDSYASLNIIPLNVGDKYPVLRERRYYIWLDDSLDWECSFAR